MRKRPEEEKCKLAFQVALRVAVPECVSLEMAVKELALLYGVPPETVDDPERIVRIGLTNPSDIASILRWIICKAILLVKSEKKELATALIESWDIARTEYQQKFGRSL